MELKSKPIELGWPYPKRKKFLDDLSGKSTGKTQPEYFQNKIQDFSVHTIPIELPKYRIDNGRTYAAQAQYVAKHNLPADFFEKDFESDKVQSAQHDILKEMIGEKGLLDFFKKNEQSTAVILSHEGYVINGNRRLCTWRELYSDNKKKYQHFEHIRVIILPQADQKDIDELEARLQVHQDIKADYPWTAEALMLKNRKTAYNYSYKELAELYEMTKAEVEEYIDMLSYADAYLANRGKPGQYTLVDRAEFAFRQIHKRRPKLGEKNEPRKEAFEKIAFCLIDNSAEGRLYQAIPDLAEHLDAVMDNINEEFDINEDPSDIEGIDLLGGGGYSSLSSLIDVLNEEKNYEHIRTIAMDVIEGERLKEKEKSKHDYVSNQIRKANTALQDAVTALDAKTKKDGIGAQIEAIEASLKKIKAWMVK